MKFKVWFINEAEREFAYPFYPDEVSPLQKDDVFRVYHGFYNMNDAINIALHGTSGKLRVGRTYSYESENNPKGLFVTLDMNKIASKFAGGHIGVIMEFMAKESELEPPTWPGGSYTVQGQMAPYFYQDPRGARLGRLAKKKEDEEEARKSSYVSIAQSHRPGLAQSMFGSEVQALYVGDLNPKNIISFWVQAPEQGAQYRSTKQEWAKMTREKFLEEYGKDFSPHKSSLADKEASYRALPPDDDFTWETVAEWFNNKVRSRSENKIRSEQDLYNQLVGALTARDGVMGILTKPRHIESVFGQYFWPRQLPQLYKWIKKMYREHGEANYRY
jgi:hypothetical protein